MSQENVEAFKRAADAFARRDMDAVLAEYDPEVEWHPGMAGLLAGETMTYRGHDGLRQLADDLDQEFSVVELAFDEYRDLGDDRLLAVGRQRIRGRESDIETVNPVAYLIEGEAGRFKRVRAFLSAGEALDAAESEST
jgi:ketosteroid isomerase-like protein